MKIFLVGYMGCGKSSLGRKIAKSGGIQFVDMDSIIEELAQSEGDLVISTGGGAPAWQDNMQRMNQIGQSVYLRRTAQQIASRLSPHGRQKRPKLRGLNDEELVTFMTENMAQREPYYALAKHCIDCASLSDEELVKKILTIVKGDE